MGASIASVQGVQGGVGPLKHVRTVNTNADIEDARGFIVQAVGAGDLTYRPVAGDADITETLVAGGFPHVCGIPVMVSAVRAASTVATVRIGYL